MGSPILFLSRPVASSVIGVCLGITLSIIFTPFLEESCIDSVEDGKSQFASDAVRKAKSLSLKEIDEPLNNDLHNLKNAGNSMQHDLELKEENMNVKETEKKVNIVVKYGNENEIRVDNNNVKQFAAVHEAPRRNPYVGKPSRPSYAYTELGIRDKLFVAVVTSPDTLDTFGVAVNLTLPQYVTTTVFFTASPSDIRRPGMTIVSFQTQRELLPLHILKYIATHAPRTYDYYYFVSDVTYVRGHALFDFVSHISVSEDLYVGLKNPYSSTENCGLDGGIIVSQRLMDLTYSELDWCVQNSHSNSPSENFGHCLTHSTGLVCTSQLGTNAYTAFYDEGLDFDSSIANLRHNASFTETITVSPIHHHTSLYKLHRFFCQLEINTTLREISDIKDSIVTLSMYTPAGREGLTWPIGVPPAMKPTSRFDVLQWDYFSSTHIYFNTDFTNEKPLAGVEKQDIDEILQATLVKMNSKQKSRYSLTRLVNGYRRFDPHRGMEYILDLEVRDAELKRIKETRVNIVRPLGQVEVVPMPYVTENVQINLVLPVRGNEQDGIGGFLEIFERTCLHSVENVVLTIVFAYTDGAYDESIFATTKSLLSHYMNKYRHVAKIVTVSLQESGSYFSEISIIDVVMRDYSGAPIVSLCSVGMVLSKDYLSRLRMNAILGWQVYFPIPFYQYKPSLIFDDKPISRNIEIKRGYGFFDTNSYEHCSFYVDDYRAARLTIRSDNAAVRGVDLFAMFVKYRKLHVFRAVEPALKHFYREILCHVDMTAEEKTRCEKRRADGLASKSRLAMLLFEHRKKSRDNLQ